MPRRNRKELLRDAQHEEEVREARQVPGYKGRWRIAWSQVVGLLLAAAILVGLVLLALHAHNPMR
jgi:hypothetical protein